MSACRYPGDLSGFFDSFGFFMFYFKASLASTIRSFQFSVSNNVLCANPSFKQHFKASCYPFPSAHWAFFAAGLPDTPILRLWPALPTVVAAVVVFVWLFFTFHRAHTHAINQTTTHHSTQKLNNTMYLVSCTKQTPTPQTHTHTNSNQLNSGNKKGGRSKEYDVGPSAPPPSLVFPSVFQETIRGWPEWVKLLDCDKNCSKPTFKIAPSAWFLSSLVVSAIWLGRRRWWPTSDW